MVGVGCSSSSGGGTTTSSGGGGTTTSSGGGGRLAQVVALTDSSVTTLCIPSSNLLFDNAALTPQPSTPHTPRIGSLDTHVQIP